MAEICPVCGEEIGSFSRIELDEIVLHDTCSQEFNSNRLKYGGKAIEKTEDQIKAEKDHKEQQQKNEKVKKQSESFITFIKRNAKKIDFTLLFVTLLFTIIFMAQFENGIWDKIFYVSSAGAIRGLDDGGVILLYIFTPYILWRVIYHYWLKDQGAG
jgi:hypothetical protein